MNLKLNFRVYQKDIKDTIHNDWFEEFMFKENWLEIPFYFNNKGKTLRFDLESKGEKESKKLIEDIFDELFAENSYIYIANYKPISTIRISKYFKTAKKKQKIHFNTRDEDYQNEKNFVEIFITSTKYFKKEKFIQDYLKDEGAGATAFISAKKGVAINFYDSRGFDFFSTDSVFLKRIENKYKEYLYDFSKDNIDE